MRFDYRKRVLPRIRSKVEEVSGDNPKALYDSLGISKDQWSRKMSGAVRFNDREISALADKLDAPKGWPFIEWDEVEAAANARALEILRGVSSATGTAGPPGPAPAPSSGQPGERTSGGRK